MRDSVQKRGRRNLIQLFRTFIFIKLFIFVIILNFYFFISMEECEYEDQRNVQYYLKIVERKNIVRRQDHYFVVNFFFYIYFKKDSFCFFFFFFFVIINKSPTSIEGNQHIFGSIPNTNITLYIYISILSLLGYFLMMIFDIFFSSYGANNHHTRNLKDNGCVNTRVRNERDYFTRFIVIFFLLLSSQLQL